MKRTIYLAAVILLLNLVALSTHAAPTSVLTADKLTKEVVATMTPEEKQARLLEIKERVQELKAMNKSLMTTEERKAYRAELKDLKKESKLIDPSLYLIGAGIVILIILLLIIF
jgi:uncharacterized protein YpuA (DUF1002 family)